MLETEALSIMLKNRSPKFCCDCYVPCFGCDIFELATNEQYKNNSECLKCLDVIQQNQLITYCPIIEALIETSNRLRLKSDCNKTIMLKYLLERL